MIKFNPEAIEVSTTFLADTLNRSLDGLTVTKSHQEIVDFLNNQALNECYSLFYWTGAGDYFVTVAWSSCKFDLENLMKELEGGVYFSAYGAANTFTWALDESTIDGINFFDVDEQDDNVLLTGFDPIIPAYTPPKKVINTNEQVEVSVHLPEDLKRVIHDHLNPYVWDEEVGSWVFDENLNDYFKLNLSVDESELYIEEVSRLTGLDRDIIITLNNSLEHEPLSSDLTSDFYTLSAVDEEEAERTCGLLSEAFEESEFSETMNVQISAYDSEVVTFYNDFGTMGSRIDKLNYLLKALTYITLNPAE